MQLRIDDIKEQGLELDYREAPEDFPALADLQEQGEASFQGPVLVSGRAQHLGELVEVEGQVRVTATVPCSRCLEPVALPLAARFAVTFSKTPTAVTDEESGEEVELSAEDLGLIPFSGDEIDLTEAIQEQVVMALPLQPLCRLDCRGLCPQCGTDLNNETCQCEPEVFNGRFGKLKDLKIDRNGNG